MPQDANNAALNFQQFDADEVFLMIDDPFRRRAIWSLALGEMKVAADLCGPGRKRHSALKHLAALCKAGIFVQKENPKDARAPFYTLSPKVAVRKEENSLVVGFGRYRLRFA
jgi:hypothetical protein